MAMDTPAAESMLERILFTPSMLSECVIAQLALAFLVSPARTDPALVAPLVCLYALREADRRAMVLYIAMTAAAIVVDLIFLFAPHHFIVRLLTLASLSLKAALLYPAVKAHDKLPSTRPGRLDPATLQLRVVETVEAALREEVQRLASKSKVEFKPPPPQPLPKPGPLPPPAATPATPASTRPAWKDKVLGPVPAPPVAAPTSRGGQSSWDEV